MKLKIDFDRISKEIAGLKNVVIQLPDGLKPRFKEILSGIKSDANIFIWGGSCFGGCDAPIYLDRFGIDAIVQFGHDEWK